MKADLHVDGVFYWIGDGEPLEDVLCLKGLEHPFEVYYDRHLIGLCSTWPVLDSAKLDKYGPAPEFGKTILTVDLDLAALCGGVVNDIDT